MSAAVPMPGPIGPDPDEVRRGIADLELLLVQAAPAAPVPVEAPQVQAPPAEATQAPMPRPRGGRRLDGNTGAVADLAAELAEARRVHALLAEGDPRLTVPTPQVLRVQRKAAEAWQVRQASQSPALLALRDARVRLWTTLLVMVSAVSGLAWSAAGVRASVMAALGLPDGSAGAWFAWAVEPALSLTLLATVGVQAYAAMRGRPVDRASAAGRTLRRTEAVTLALILILNCWPSLPWVADPFRLLPLLVHALGPVAAVVGVRALPALWSILGCLPVPDRAGATPPPTGPTYWANGRAMGTSPVADLIARAQGLMATGQLPAQPSATLVQKVLRCGMDDARAVRDALRWPGAAS